MAVDRRYHPVRMPAEWFDELAHGGGSPEAVGFLVHGERTRRLVLLAELLDRLEERPEALAGLGTVAAAWDLISAAGRGGTESTEALLLSPQVGGWIAHLLRRLHGRADGPPLWADAGHLFAVCLVARVLAGLDADLVVPVRDGTVVLPTLGLADLTGRAPGGPGSGGPATSGEFTTATARLRGQTLEFGHGGVSVTVRPLGGPSRGWTPLRRLRLPSAGPASWVWLDDLDPYRDLDEPVAPDRLDEDEAAAWQQLLTQAATVLRTSRTGPGRLRVEDVRAIVPWRTPPGDLPDDGAPLPSASTGDAFGSMVIARPRDGVMLAETMVHEFQHSKLGALLHLYPLLRDDGAEVFYAPWRADPRHLTGLLHGAYAFVGVAGFWRDRMADGEGPGAPRAAFHFALHRLQTRRVVRTLRDRAALTVPGARLVDGLAATLDGWLREPVPTEIAARARAAATSNLVEWRLRNLRCREEERSALTDRCREGAAPPPATAFGPLVTGTGEDRHWADGRAPLYRDPPTEPPPGSGADGLLVSGQVRAALDTYAAGLRDDPSDRHALAGWLLAAAACGGPRHRALLRRPERFPAALDAAGVRPGDPGMRRVADWLCS